MRPSTSLLLLALSSSGCTALAPDDVLLILGRAQGRVVLERRLHYACDIDDPALNQGPFEVLQTQEPDAGGGYVFEVYQAQARLGDQRACFRVREEHPTRAELRLQMWSGDSELPPLLRWDAPPVFDGARWALPAVPDLPRGNLRTTHLVEWQVDAESGPLWRQEATGAWTPTPALLEDFAQPAVHIRALAEVMAYDDSAGPLFINNTDARLTLDTPAVTMAAGTTTPLSRGAACFVEGASRSPCPLVDGSLAEVNLWQGNTPSRTLELRWGGPRPVQSLVVRGLQDGGGELVVEVAEGDLGGWTHVATLPAPSRESDDIARSVLATPGRWEVVPLGGVRADRLRLTTPYAFSRVRELSVFE